MAIDRVVLLAFAVMGAFWAFGLCVITLMSSPGVILGAVVYVLVFTVALASRRVPIGLSLLAAWTAAVVAAGALMQSADNEVGTVIFLGGVLGTVAFAAWVVPGFVFLLLLDPDPHLRKIAAKP